MKFSHSSRSKAPSSRNATPGDSAEATAAVARRSSGSKRLSRREALAILRKKAAARRARWAQRFPRYLPFTGWRVPGFVEQVVARFQRALGKQPAQRPSLFDDLDVSLLSSSRMLRQKIDYERGIWRLSSAVDKYEKKVMLSVSPGELDEAYVDDSWQSASAGQQVIWTDANGQEVPLVYGYEAFSSIADGVAAVGDGGVVNIAEGGYDEILASPEKGITFRPGGDAAAEVTVAGIDLDADDTLDLDVLGVNSYDRFSVAPGSSTFDLGSARLLINEADDLPGDGASVLGLLASERTVSVGATGALTDRLGRPIGQESILSSSRLNFRFDKASGEFQGVFLTPLAPPTTVYVDGRWADLAAGDPVVTSGGPGIIGHDAFGDLDEAAALVGEGGTIKATSEFAGAVLPAFARAEVVLDVDGLGGFAASSGGFSGISSGLPRVIYVYNAWAGIPDATSVAVPDASQGNVTIGTTGFANFTAALAAWPAANNDGLAVYDNGTGYAESVDLSVGNVSLLPLTLFTSGFKLTGGQTLTFDAYDN